MLRKNNDQKNEDTIPTRRMFDWFTNLFGLKHETDTKPDKSVNRTRLDLKIEKTEENILESINRIADAMEKISNSVDIQLHMMTPFDKGFNIKNTHLDSTRGYDRHHTNITEESSEESSDKASTVDVMEPVYRIANTVEKINNNMELRLHMLLAKKGGKSTNKYAARNSRRSTFEWMYNLVFGKKKIDPSPTEKANTTIHDLLTNPYDENAEGDILEAVDRIGFALERINSNLELQLHMKLDCKCDEQTRVKRKYEIHKRTGRMDRDFYQIVKKLEDNTPTKVESVRRKRDVEKNDTETEVVQNKSENTLAPLSITTEESDDNAKTTSAPSLRTETVTDKSRNTKISRRQDADEVKLKLLNYIYESYNEITNKIDPLSKIKAQYQNDNMYKIGYIMSNIDTLEVNLKNMKKDVDTNKHDFEETKILNVLDTFMASNRIVSSLIDSLKSLGKPVDELNIAQQTTVSTLFALN